MGRSLETDVRDDATGPGGSGAARGSRVMFVLRRTRSAPLLPASLLLAILIAVTVTTGLAGPAPTSQSSVPRSERPWAAFRSRWSVGCGRTSWPCLPHAARLSRR